MITLLLSGDFYNGPPVANVTLNGVALPPVEVRVLRGQPSQRVSIECPPGACELGVAFNNDLWGGTADTDRNLYLDGIEGVAETVSGHAFTSNATITLSLTVLPTAPVVTPVVAAPPVVAATGPMDKLDILHGDLQAILAALRGTPIVAAPTQGPVVAPPSAAVTYPAGWTTLTLSPSDNIRAAIAVAGKAFKLRLKRGYYPQCVVIPHGLDGWEIASETGSAGDVRLDGLGGLTVAVNSASTGSTPGVPTRLAYGKGVILAASPGKIRGIEVTGGGTNATDGHDGQAGVYWDVGDANGGECIVEDCMIRHNQNGIFGNTQNRNAHYIMRHNDFIDNSVDGGSHDTYLNGTNCKASFIDNLAPGSDFGNNFKTRVEVVEITDGWHGSQNANRWVELADGGTLTINGGIYVGNDAGQNVYGNGTESTSKGPGDTFWNNSDIYLGNRDSDFCTAGKFLGVGLKVHANPGGVHRTFNSKGGELVGLSVTDTAAAPPVPAYRSGAH